MDAQARAAQKFQDDAIARSGHVTAKALRLWSQVPLADLDAGWRSIELELSSTINAVVAQNAASSGRMVSAVGRADGVGAGDVVVPNAFLGVDSSGRSASGLLFGAVTTTKERIGKGVGSRSALLAGASYLASMTKTVIADMARSASLVSATGRGYVYYVRVVNPGACDRCAILAGSDMFSRHFERHPACRCTSVPVQERDGIPDGLLGSPEEHFASLSEAEQDRIYGKAGAEAIRLGADPIQVVNARRGGSGMFYSRSYPAPLNSGRRMQRVPIGVRPNGTPIMGYTTIEGVTKRGVYGRAQIDIGGAFAKVGDARYSSAVRRRLMPETIIDLTNDVDLRRTLLRDAGYLEIPIRDTSSNAWIFEHAQQQQLDRVTADTFYRSLGIDLY